MKKPQQVFICIQREVLKLLAKFGLKLNKMKSILIKLAGSASQSFRICFGRT